MSRKFLKIFFQSLGIQIMFSVVAMIFYINFLNKLYTVFTAWLLLFPLYSTFWKFGNKEGKMIVIHNNNLKEGQSSESIVWHKGALLALPHFMVNIILLLLTFITNNDYLLFAQTILTFPFAGFLPPLTDVLGTEYLVSRFLVCVAMYLSCAIGYIAGISNFSLLDKYYRKIVYKNTSDKKN